MIRLTDKYVIDESVAYIITDKSQVNDITLTKEEISYANKMFENKQEFIHINSMYKSSFIIFVNSDKDKNTRTEEIRNYASKTFAIISETRTEKLNIIDLSKDLYSLAFVEALMLSNYSFNKYFTDNKEKDSSLKEIKIVSNKLTKNDISEIESVVAGVIHARDIVNEPLSYMTAKKLSEEIEVLGKKYGFKTEILDKGKIESLKMGGLIAVNRGSVDPPTFSILKWEPEKAVNKQPIVLVGKGLVFDTGGINLKPSGSLETMKCDKSGGATVVGVICALAKAKIPLHVIGLVPATDNRPGNNAYVPEDIITMYDGTTVEISNTDAEGRLILADALSYAKKYKPELVIDLATLTGAAVVAIGESASAIFGNSPANISELKEYGFESWERLVELPLWEDYKEQLKSPVADLKNCGSRWGGAITAAKFLEHFTDYNWIHLDIAGPAFTEKKDSYRGQGGTGVGVRLLFNFLKNKTK
ncbi:MAG TPA: leucyl aminopeptidase [Bacteroidales bacterium]|nr:leucyl aminopeptidase [Bacteroidales bacterium]